jgi:uncharacterized protein YmfQ (DUF2313 family)
MSYKDILSGVEQELKSKSNAENVETFLSANVNALESIISKAQALLDSIQEPSVKEHLTANWLQGKIAITEDYMTTIHDFVKYSSANDDKEDMAPASLWENIRKKKLREGKKYRPAKPGDKDRPNKDAWKKAQK